MEILTQSNSMPNLLTKRPASATNRRSKVFFENNAMSKISVLFLSDSSMHNYSNRIDTSLYTPPIMPQECTTKSKVKFNNFAHTTELPQIKQFNSLSELKQIANNIRRDKAMSALFIKENNNKLLNELADKYYLKIIAIIKKATLEGQVHAYINFNRIELFQTGLGKPEKICNDIFALIIKQHPHLEGLKHDIWNNGSFTIYLKW